MAFDAHSNLAVSTIATAPAPATSGTTLTVAVGEGARFPVAPFNCTVWPATALPTPVNAEVVRVTARTGDVLTITRAQEATTARSIVAGDLIAATITAKTITDIESGVKFPLIEVGTYPDVLRVAPFAITRTTPEGSDGGYFQINGGGAAGSHRGSQITLTGVQQGGRLDFAGGGDAGPINFITGPLGATRGRMHPSGGFSWGTTVDPGAVGNITMTGTLLCGSIGSGPPYIALFPSGQFRMALAGTSGLAGDFFTSGTSVGAGSIALNGGTTAYNTTSDARLKTDHGRHADPDVLRRTVIHAFTWIHDGRPGRGVFAQEAVEVAPFAVTVGTDERDDDGHFIKPWGVDYSKYVPDLIVGWQQHDTRIGALFGDQLLAAERLTALEKRLSIPQPMLLQRVRDWMDRIRAWLFPKDPSWIG